MASTSICNTMYSHRRAGVRSVQSEAPQWLLSPLQWLISRPRKWLCMYSPLCSAQINRCPHRCVSGSHSNFPSRLQETLQFATTLPVFRATNPIPAGVRGLDMFSQCFHTSTHGAVRGEACSGLSLSLPFTLHHNQESRQVRLPPHAISRRTYPHHLHSSAGS